LCSARRNRLENIGAGERQRLLAKDVLLRPRRAYDLVRVQGMRRAEHKAPVPLSRSYEAPRPAGSSCAWRPPGGRSWCAGCSLGRPTCACLPKNLRQRIALKLEEGLRRNTRQAALLSIIKAPQTNPGELAPRLATPATRSRRASRMV
jgi:hypothetical protein